MNEGSKQEQRKQTFFVKVPCSIVVEGVVRIEAKNEERDDEGESTKQKSAKVILKRMFNYVITFLYFPCTMRLQGNELFNLN